MTSSRQSPIYLIGHAQVTNKAYHVNRQKPRRGKLSSFGALSHGVYLTPQKRTFFDRFCKRCCGLQISIANGPVKTLRLIDVPSEAAYPQLPRPLFYLPWRFRRYCLHNLIPRPLRVERSECHFFLLCPDSLHMIVQGIASPEQRYV